MGAMTAETLRRRLQEWSMHFRFLSDSDDVLPMGLNDIADLLEVEGTWDAFSEKYGITRDHRLFVEDKDADMGREVWFVWFRNGNDFFIAYGPDPMKMRVYRPGDGVYHHRTPSMWFPSCTKFMPYATGGEIRKVTRRKIRRRYGRPLGPYEQDPRRLGYEEGCWELQEDLQQA